MKLQIYVKNIQEEDEKLEGEILVEKLQNQQQEG